MIRLRVLFGKAMHDMIRCTAQIGSDSRSRETHLTLDAPRSTSSKCPLLQGCKLSDFLDVFSIEPRPFVHISNKVGSRSEGGRTRKRFSITSRSAQSPLAIVVNRQAPNSHSMCTGLGAFPQWSASLFHIQFSCACIYLQQVTGTV